MYVHEAIEERTEEKPYIARKDWAAFKMKIYPTDSPDCCICENKMNPTPKRGWNPFLQDLTADDWETQA